MCNVMVLAWFDLAIVILTPIKSCPGYISEIIRCRKLILGRDIG